MKKGFTLAEIIITLGIIGVISALTMPGLINNYQNNANATQLHKVYSMFLNAFALQMEEQTASNLIEGLKSNGRTKLNVAGDFLTTRFTISENCAGKAYECFADQYRSLNGTAIVESKNLITNGNFYGVILTNGASIAMRLSDSIASNDTALGYIYVDVNGLKGPNIIGRDFFRFSIWIDGTLDDLNVSPNCRSKNSCLNYDSSRTARLNNFRNYCYYTDDTTAIGCVGQVMEDGWKITY